MRQYLKFISPLAFLLFTAKNLFAQGNVEEASGNNSFNPVMIGLITLIIILLFAIAALGNVLRGLAYVYRNKMRNEKSKSPTMMKVLLLLFAFSFSSLNLFAQEAVSAAIQSTELISGIPAMDFYILMSIVVMEIVVLSAIVIYMSILLRAINAKPELASEARKVMKKVPFWDRFHGAVTIEREKDILLDHDYDGINELDNSLPPWWKYGFYLTIVVAVIYMWYYHVGGNGPSSHDEYIASVERGEELKAAYLAKAANSIDENNVVMLDLSGIEDGKLLYQKNCAACHLNDGGGSVGPNLTDEYWLHGGSLQDVFKSIKYGWQDKGMKPWKDDFSPKQLAQLASFVKSLQGTQPAFPKEKQGDLYLETTTTDSTTAFVNLANSEALASK